jgi:hypothetical protein
MVVSIKAEGMLVTIPQIHPGCMKEYFRPSSSFSAVFLTLRDWQSYNKK